MVAKQITELWAWVVTEPGGGEGVPASTRLLPGHYTPLIGADEARIRSYETEALTIAGLPLKPRSPPTSAARRPPVRGAAPGRRCATTCWSSSSRRTAICRAPNSAGASPPCSASCRNRRS
jgi:hypothetical protein